MDYVGPFTFNCARCLMDSTVLLPCIWFLDRKSRKRRQVPAIPGARKTLVMGGICCGVALCLAGNFQQFGIQYTTMGKAGFITACYIVVVPALGFLLGKKCSPVAAGAMILSLTSLYVLCTNGGELSVNKGDLLMLICTSPFAVRIMVISFSSPAVGGVKMPCIRFFVSRILLGGAMLVNETPEMSQIMTAWTSILYAGTMSYGVAYVLQIAGQKGTNPTVTSLILNLELSTSVLAGWVVLGQRLSSREVLGCILMFGAIILAQIPVGRNRKASLNTEGNQEA